jgi:DHA1 family tetracycline resistance protein-like MFS transporter
MSEAIASTDPTPTAPRGALAIILFIAFLDLMGFGIILPQLPFYAMHYQVSAVKVTLLLSIYSFCQFMAAPLLGSVSDRYGRRPVLVFSQLGSAVGYAILGLVTVLNLTNLGFAMALIYLSRVIDGLTGGNISTAQAYISDVTTPQNRAKGMGLFGAAFGVGFAAGPVVGGLVGNDTNHASWPAFTAAAFSLAAMFLSWAKLPESRTHRPVGDEIWLHPSRLLLIVKRSTLLQLLLISFSAMTAFAMLEGIVALYFRATFTYGPNHTPYGPRQVGWFFGYVGFFIVIVQGGLIGRLTKKFGEWPLTIVGALMVCVGLVLYVMTGWHPVLPLLLVAGAINTIGRSLQQPPIASLISKFSDRSEQGSVFGVYHGLSSLARALGPLIAGLLFVGHKHTVPYAVSAVMMLCVAGWLAMLAWSVRKDPKRATASLAAAVVEPA